MFYYFFAFLWSSMCKQNFRFFEKVTIINGLVSRRKNITCIFRAKNVLFLRVTFSLLETKLLMIVTFSKNLKFCLHIDNYKNAKQMLNKNSWNFFCYGLKIVKIMAKLPDFQQFSFFFQHIFFNCFCIS